MSQQDERAALLRYADALDAIYNDSPEGRRLVSKHFGVLHSAEVRQARASQAAPAAAPKDSGASTLASDRTEVTQRPEIGGEPDGMAALNLALLRGEWPHTMDARVWAAEFIKRYPQEWATEEDMIGWFANAIMTGWDTALLRRKIGEATDPRTLRAGSASECDRHDETKKGTR